MKLHHLNTQSRRIWAPPMRVLRSLVVRLIQIEGPGMATTIMTAEIDREQVLLAARHREAEIIDRRLQETGELVTAYLTDDRSPGVIDAQEAPILCRRLLAIKAPAHHHTAALERMG